jgi:septal ring factor EnvC (AmiA/AmiB activator)
MSTRTVTTTTTPSSTNLTSDPSSHPAIQALSLTEQMNQEVVREMNTTLKSFEKMFAEMQKTLNASLEENKLLKKDIIQLNTKIKENEALHTAEMKKATKTIATLSKSVTTLESDLTRETCRRRELRDNFEKLVEVYNKHGHPCPIVASVWNQTPVGWKPSGTPSNPYTK